eukprot:1947251-Prorocentrum_lima.AAC.1
MGQPPAIPARRVHTDTSWRWDSVPPLLLEQNRAPTSGTAAHGWQTRPEATPEPPGTSWSDWT